MYDAVSESCRTLPIERSFVCLPSNGFGATAAVPDCICRHALEKLSQSGDQQLPSKKVVAIALFALRARHTPVGKLRLIGDSCCSRS